jgi:hypothetical protein
MAAAKHIRLVLEEAQRKITPPADAETVLADGNAVLSALATGCPRSVRGSIHDSIL